MQIADYSYSLNPSQKAIIRCLHDLIMENPGIELKERYKLPFYYRKTWICYFSATKSGNIEWAFTRGNEMSNGTELLHDRGRKQVKSVIFSSVSQVDIAECRTYLQEALLLDEHIPYSVRKNSNS